MSKIISNYSEGLYCKGKKSRCPLEVFSIKADKERKHTMRHYFTTVVSKRDLLIAKFEEENDIISDILKIIKEGITRLSS